MGYNECVARIYTAENGWTVEITEKKERTSKKGEFNPPVEKTYLATSWADVLKLLNSNVKGKGNDADYAEAFGAADKD